jgi:hypothetical protein
LTNLKVQVVTLRKLLGHPAIGTVPGRGYRFAFPISEDNGDSDTVATNLVEVAGSSAWNASGATADGTAPLCGNLPSHQLPLFGRNDDLSAVRLLLLVHPLVTVSSGSVSSPAGRALCCGVTRPCARR